mmetsp:Transcript_54303/g.117495  ORF Transcript_54303/g.117495 Transcript_54303/m.117495 type:complete len:458 (+) Transcript_54303:44-1417(+)
MSAPFLEDHRFEVENGVGFDSGPNASDDAGDSWDTSPLTMRGEESPVVAELLALVHEVCDPSNKCSRKRQALESLCIALQPHQLSAASRRIFVEKAMDRGTVAAAVQLVECGDKETASAACNFLGDFAFNSDAGAHAVLKVFDRIVNCLEHIFEDMALQHLLLLDAAILLCVNIAATCPAGHVRLVPLVWPVCVQIIKHPTASDKLRGNTILLLANLSTTVSQELRSLHVGDVLLDLVLDPDVPETRKSVAESVIIFLHGHQRCREIDRLMEADVVGNYCVPILELALSCEDFRGMYPHLMYSARLFQVLGQSREYAETLVAHKRVVPLLLRANRRREGPVLVESDLDGRRLALEALTSFVRFRLWPRAASCDGGDETLEEDSDTLSFIAHDLPPLLADSHKGIRWAAVELWARLNVGEVITHLLLGRHAEVYFGLPPGLWQRKVLGFLFPFLSAGL